jgi:ubiquitin carboxyl-terminal hydrolase 4/11/15
MDPLKKIVQYKLTVPKMGKVKDLCMALSKFTGVSHDKMVVTDVYNHRFHKVYNQKDALSHILERDDIFIYEVPVTSEDDPECVIIHVYWRELRTIKGFSSVATQYSLFGQPLLVPVPRKGYSSRILYNTILERTKRYIHPPSIGCGPSSASLFSFR